jgi:hypothetical protein
MRRFAAIPDAFIDQSSIKKETLQVRETARNFGIWGVTTAISQTATVPLVAYIAPSASSSIFLAFTLVCTIVAAVAAVSNALVAPLAKFLGTGDKQSASRLTIIATVTLWVILTIASLIVYFLLDRITAYWVGHAVFTPQYQLFFVLLAMQYGLRSTALASSLVLAMGGVSRALLLLPVVESLSVLALALPIALVSGPNAFLLALGAAGALGALITAWYTTNKVLHVKSAITQAGAILPLVVCLQILTLIIWGSLALPHYAAI